MRIRDPGWRQFGSGIRDGKKSDPGSGINIPDPPHWFEYIIFGTVNVIVQIESAACYIVVPQIVAASFSSVSLNECVLFADQDQSPYPYIQCCCIRDGLSRTPIFTHPGSRIPDPKQQQKIVVKKLIVLPFFVATNFSELNIILFLKCRRKKFGPVFKELFNFLVFTQKFVTKLSKIWVLNPGSGRKLFRIPDPGVKKAPDPDPQHCFYHKAKIVRKTLIHTVFLLQKVCKISFHFLSA